MSSGSWTRGYIVGRNRKMTLKCITSSFEVVLVKTFYLSFMLPLDRYKYVGVYNKIVGYTIA